MIASEPPDEMESVRGVFTVQARHTVGASSGPLESGRRNEDGRSSSRKLQHGNDIQRDTIPRVTFFFHARHYSISGD